MSSVPTGTTQTTATPHAPKFAKTQYPKFWLKCAQCQAFVSASPHSVFRYLTKLLKVELDALDTRATNAAKAGHQAKEQ